MSYNDFDVDKARELREKAKDEVKKQSRIGLIATMLPSLLLVALIIYALAQLLSTPEPATRYFYAVIGFLAVITHLGLWATYGLDARILILLKEIKQLRLDFLAERETPLARATGGAESLSPWAAGAIRPKFFATAIVTLCVLGGAFGMFVATHMRHNRPETFGGQEVAEVHVTADGTFRVHSRISISKCASNVASIPLHIPQPGATLESVTVGGRSIPFAPVRDEEDTYTIMPGLPEHALRNATIEVVWSPQEEDIRVKNGVRYFDLPLRGVIPITAYTANAVIDDGAPYQFAYGELVTPSVRSTNLYWTRRSDGTYHQDPMGTCGVAVKEIADSL